MFNLQLIFFFLPFLFVLLLTPLTIKIATSLKLVDNPKTHKHPAIIHKKTLPRAGGLPIYIAIALSIFILIADQKIFIPIIFAGGVVVIIGLLDDKYDISAYIRFLGNIFCALIVVIAGLQVPFITNPLGGILNFSNVTYEIFGISFTIGSLLAVLWITWVMNMLNWSKGVDGQMPGVAAIAAIIIGIASLRFPVLTDINILVSQASFIVAGAALGFLVYNFYPAKIFPGYSATILGFMIGVLSIMSGVKLATAILVMGVPAADFLFTFTRRIVNRKSPFRGDREHLHHLLLKQGLGQRKIALFYWAMSALLGVFALNLSSRGKLFAIILVVVLVGAIIFTLKFIDKRNFEDNA